MYEQKTIRNQLKFKQSLNMLDIKSKMTLLGSLKIIHGALYIKVYLKRIDLAKEIFLLHFEQGQEVWIPTELSQD